MLLLGIDTSGHTASVCVCDEENIYAENFIMTRLTHSQIIMPLAMKALEDAGKSINDVDGLAVVKGPGSYTGLRIGIAAAKGICMGNSCKCAGVSALEALAYNFRGTNTLVCAVMHARIDLVYNALFEVKGKTVRRLTPDRIISEDDLLKEVTNKDYILVGDYAKEFSEKSGLTLSAVQFMYPRASSVCYAAFESGFASAKDLNPEYLQITKAEKDLIEKER